MTTRVLPWTVDDLAVLATTLERSGMTLGQLLDEMRAAAAEVEKQRHYGKKCAHDGYTVAGCDDCAARCVVAPPTPPAPDAVRALATFWAKVWTRIADGGCDMLELDDDAVEAGLMALVPHAQPCNDETCRCEGADEVYKLTPAGRAALTARATQEAGD